MGGYEDVIGEVKETVDNLYQFLVCESLKCDWVLPALDPSF